MEGRAIYARSHGTADHSTGVSADDRTLWYLASTSKSFTGFGSRSSPAQGRFDSMRRSPRCCLRALASRGAAAELTWRASSATALPNDNASSQRGFKGAVRRRGGRRFGPRRTGRDDGPGIQQSGQRRRDGDRRRAARGMKRYLEQHVYTRPGSRDLRARVSGIDPRRIARRTASAPTARIRPNRSQKRRHHELRWRTSCHPW